MKNSNNRNIDSLPETGGEVLFDLVFSIVLFASMMIPYVLLTMWYHHTGSLFIGGLALGCGIFSLIMACPLIRSVIDTICSYLEKRFQHQTNK